MSSSRIPTGRPCLALLPGTRTLERLQPTLDTGRRKTNTIEVGNPSGPGDRWSCKQELGLVFVPGEEEPRWIAVERIEPAEASKRKEWTSWMRVELEMKRPRVDRAPRALRVSAHRNARIRSPWR